jgi:hypothetical protein
MMNNSRSFQYVYIFKGETLNVLPWDTIWKDEYAILIDENGNNAFKNLGIAHGDDVRDIE